MVRWGLLAATNVCRMCLDCVNECQRKIRSYPPGRQQKRKVCQYKCLAKISNPMLASQRGKAAATPSGNSSAGRASFDPDDIQVHRNRRARKSAFRTLDFGCEISVV